MRALSEAGRGGFDGVAGAVLTRLFAPPRPAPLTWPMPGLTRPMPDEAAPPALALASLNGARVRAVRQPRPGPEPMPFWCRAPHARHGKSATRRGRARHSGSSVTRARMARRRSGRPY